MKDLLAPRLIVAMDYHNAADCLAMARRLDPQWCRLKVGKELFTAAGPALAVVLGMSWNFKPGNSSWRRAMNCPGRAHGSGGVRSILLVVMRVCRTSHRAPV